MTKTLNLLTRIQTPILFATIAIATVLLSSSVAHAALLTRQLQQGMTGSDVSSLQTFLASDVTIYPQGLVTGFFGPMTFTAVSKFQSKNGIASVGRVGPVTLAAINAQMGGGWSGADSSAPLIRSITLTTTGTSMNVTWSTNENASSALYYSLAPIALTDGLSGTSASVAVSGTPAGPSNAGLLTSHSVNVPNLQPNTKYYYVIHAADQAGNVNVTWPATFTTN